MKRTDERLLELCESHADAWHALERYREKLIEHRAEKGFGLLVRQQAGEWGVWIRKRR